MYRFAELYDAIKVETVYEKLHSDSDTMQQIVQDFKIARVNGREALLKFESLEVMFTPSTYLLRCMQDQAHDLVVHHGIMSSLTPFDPILRIWTVRWFVQWTSAVALTESSDCKMASMLVACRDLQHSVDEAVCYP